MTGLSSLFSSLIRGERDTPLLSNSYRAYCAVCRAATVHACVRVAGKLYGYCVEHTTESEAK